MRSNGTTDRNRYVKSKDTLFLLSRTSREGTLKSTTESTHLETAPGVANSFIFNFFLLGHLGELHIEVPFIQLGQLATIFYFSYFIIIIPLITTLENILFYVGNK